ncbi:MAG: histidine kinase [Chitinophagaceae bacterium]
MKVRWCILTLVFPVLCMSQQRMRIDSLKKLIRISNDSISIDCLNNLSSEYYINALSETYVNVETDTAIWYASQAHSEAAKIHYKKGVAEALLNIGEIFRYRNDFSRAEKYLRQSITLFEQLHDFDKYSRTQVTLGFCLYSQARFTEAKLAYELALPYYVSVGNKEWESMLFRMISLTYSARGYNEKAFENTMKAIRITYKISDARGVISSPENMANLYRNAGDFETAMTYIRLAAQKAKPDNPVRYYKLMGESAVVLGQLDSAIYYYKESHKYVTLRILDTTIIQRSLSYTRVRIGEIYLKQYKYDLAIEQFRSALPFFIKGTDKISIMRILCSLAGCYQAKQNLTTSLWYAKRLFAMASQTGSRPFVRDAYELYWKIYDRQVKTDSAYKYNLKYVAIKDSILGDEYRRNIALSEMRSKDEQQKTKISLLQADQQFNKEKLSLQQQQLKSESLIRYILFATTAAFLLIGISIFRNINLKRKNENLNLEHALELHQLQTKKTNIEFQQQATALEMQALRAQMNPHFIFNCLSSINRYILINKTEEASDYLTKFSRLIRMVLQNSQKTYNSLENELEALRLYLDLERSRFKNAFNYSITFINEIDINAVHIPPMLIQPFAENAIWHGLMHKKEVGWLEIQLGAEGKMLTCAISDNGIGRPMAASLKSRSAETDKSMGLSITAGRLALLNKSKNEAALLNIEDLVDGDGKSCGTKVILSIPYKDLTEVV